MCTDECALAWAGARMDGRMNGRTDGRTARLHIKNVSYMYDAHTGASSLIAHGPTYTCILRKYVSLIPAPKSLEATWF